MNLSLVNNFFFNGVIKDPSNYRQISILPSFSKIYERTMSYKLNECLDNNHLTDNEQRGFRPGKSVVRACIYFLESVIYFVDSRGNVAGVFMDLSKAFDSITLKIVECDKLFGNQRKDLFLVQGIFEI